MSGNWTITSYLVFNRCFEWNVTIISLFLSFFTTKFNLSKPFRSLNPVGCVYDKCYVKSMLKILLGLGVSQKLF